MFLRFKVKETHYYNQDKSRLLTGHNTRLNSYYPQAHTLFHKLLILITLYDKLKRVNDTFYQLYIQKARRIMGLFIICFLTTFFACTIGTICGMGGGIIIKPVLDATGVMSVSTITFMSGCTVIAMTCWSVGKTMLKKESVIDLKNTTYLAIGAAIGGLSGRQLYIMVAKLFDNADTAGGVQALLLLFATLATFIYTINKNKINAKKITSPIIAIIIGLLLGILGSFLGIGGGPFNVAVLYYFFSMNTKTATQNSLYIVLFSQVTSTLKTVCFDTIPTFDVIILIGMVVFGIVGSEFGRQINKKIDDRQATYLFEGAMLLIMCINIYNVIKFFN